MKRESIVISMVVEEWKKDQTEQFSPVQRIKGYPWRLRLFKTHSDDSYRLSLICDKSSESELWQCAATITSANDIEIGMVSQTFKSWDIESRSCDLGSIMIKCGVSLMLKVIVWNDDSWRIRPTPVRSDTNLIIGEDKKKIPVNKDTNFGSWDYTSHQQRLCTKRLPAGSVLYVNISTIDDGESYRRRPSLDLVETCDGILVFGNMEKKIEVNKKSLASQSVYFDRLFFGNFKEKDMKEIPIRDVEDEDFSTIMAELYASEDNSHVNQDNVERMLQLADRFELKIVEDRAVSFLLSPSSSNISLPKKLLMADQYNLPLLKDALYSKCNSIEIMKGLSESPEWNQLSKDILRVLFKKFCI